MSGNQDSMLSLSSYDRACLDRSWEWLRDPEIRALTMTPEFTREDQLHFFESLPTRSGYHIWGLSLDGRPVGAAGLKNVRGACAEYWGYLGERDCWGKGLGKQLMLLIEAEARKLGLSSLDLRVLATNSRAISLYLKMGYVETTLDAGEGVVFMAKEI